MFSLRQRTSDFHVKATLELIGEIGSVVATANDGYFTRAFCLLEVYVRCSLGSRYQVSRRAA